VVGISSVDLFEVKLHHWIHIPGTYVPYGGDIATFASYLFLCGFQCCRSWYNVLDDFWAYVHLYMISGGNIRLQHICMFPLWRVCTFWRCVTWPTHLTYAFYANQCVYLCLIMLLTAATTVCFSILSCLMTIVHIFLDQEFMVHFGCTHGIYSPQITFNSFIPRFFALIYHIHTL
jgi:hypothetical protein